MENWEEQHRSAQEKECASSTESEISRERGEKEVVPIGEMAVGELDAYFASASEEAFCGALGTVGAMLRSGGGAASGSRQLHGRLLRHYYYSLYKEMQERSDSQERMLHVLSLLAEIVRQQPKAKLPFTRKIVLALLTFDLESVSSAGDGEHIMAIFATLLANQAAQPKLMLRLNVHQQLKLGLLKLLANTQKLTTLKILLHALRQVLSAAKLTISSEEMRVWGVQERIRTRLGDHGWGVLRVWLCHPKPQDQYSRKTLSDLVSV